ncbi:MAG TPA: GNAT family N-acetyltransferase [Chloroflexota bacterium]|nr:GNAT family N-acetyltransferase [Chloroflexota bacterium]
MATGPAETARGAAGGISVRELTPADLDPLRWVIYRAYYEVLLELYGRESASRYEVRSLDFMAMYLRRDPHGSFVAETADGTLAGGLFCFVWGEVGWFGSLAVAPQLQGKGVAQRLTQRAIDYLRARGCRRIGLETWPEAERTRHLYTKLGFERGRLTVKLSRRVTPATTGAAAGWVVSWVTPAQREGIERAIEAVSEISRAAASGDARPEFANEVRVAVVSSFGELAVVRDEGGMPRAFALALTRKPSGAPVGSLDVRLMVVASGGHNGDDVAALDALLAALDGRARRLSARGVTCDVNLAHDRAAGLLRQRGFRPIYELVRMELPRDGDDATSSPTLEYARWAG